MSRQSMNVLITGASSGIGLEFSKLFAAQGYDLILVARSAEKLAALAAELGSQHNIHTATLVKNLENPAAPGEIYTELQQRGLQVDILVNNAGYGDHAAFAEADVTRLLNMIQLNVTSLTHLARLFLPGMLARGYGRILNVGSTGSFAPAPYMAVYAATKAFVLSLSEALYEETKNTGVSVTALCPGYTRTEFQATAGVNPKNLMTAEQVARAGYQGLMKGQAIVTPGIQNQLLALSAKWMPRALVRSISAGVVKSIAR